MKIWVLVENTKIRDDLIAEHGLSLYIETASHRILFDAGQSDAFFFNAEKIGVDLKAVDLAILSHGHYDHGGGMERFLQWNSIAPVYVSRDAFAPHFHGEEKYIGLDPALKRWDRWVYVEDHCKIDAELSLHSCNRNTRPYPADSFGLQMQENGLLRPDDFRHEQYLLIREGEKTVLFSGCSHKGICNIATWFQPDVLIGGFHFSKLDPRGKGADQLQKAERVLLQFPTLYYTGHCTGEEQYRFLRQSMGDRLRALSTGQLICLD